MHFRRGDYVSNQIFHRLLGPVGPDYYQRAVALLREKHPDAVLYIFSDDIDAVEREFRPGGPRHFIRAVEPWQAHDSLRLTSLWDHQIIANGTFSWRAAWLNPPVWPRGPGGRQKPEVVRRFRRLALLPEV